MHARQVGGLVSLRTRIDEGHGSRCLHDHIAEHWPDSLADRSKQSVRDGLILGPHQGSVLQTIAPPASYILRSFIRLGIQHQRPGLPADQGHAPGELGILGDIDALVKELGGYFQQSSVSNRGNSGYRYGSYTIRIPSAQFDTFLQKAGTLCHLVYSSTGTDDVSETYYDTEARLETARIKLERLQALLAKATSMDDIITIESAISETEWDIENLSGTLRRYDALVDYATIDVELSEVYKLSGQDEAVTTFGGRLGQSFVNGLQAVGSALEDFAVWLAYSWVWLAVIATVIVVIVRVMRRKSGGKKFSLKRKGKGADAETKE